MKQKSFREQPFKLLRSLRRYASFLFRVYFLETTQCLLHFLDKRFQKYVTWFLDSISKIALFVLYHTYHVKNLLLVMLCSCFDAKSIPLSILASLSTLVETNFKKSIFIPNQVLSITVFCSILFRCFCLIFFLIFFIK